MGTSCQVKSSHFGSSISRRIGYTASMSRIKEIRTSLGWSQQRLADEVEASSGVSTSKQQIWKLETGARKMSEDWLNLLAPALGVSKAELLGEDTGVPEGTSLLPIVGEVQAGVFNEAAEYAADEHQMVATQTDDFPRGAKVFILKAVGDSMNQADIPDGSLLFCVNIHDFMTYWRDMKSGDKVVVHRVRNDGYHESTVKEIIFGEDGDTWLQPRSDNPRHATIHIPSQIAQGDGIVDDHEIHIHAVVIGRYFQPFVS